MAGRGIAHVNIIDGCFANAVGNKVIVKGLKSTILHTSAIRQNMQFIVVFITPLAQLFNLFKIAVTFLLHIKAVKIFRLQHHSSYSANSHIYRCSKFYTVGKLLFYDFGNKGRGSCDMIYI